MSDMDLIASVQCTQFAALRDMQRRREQLAEIERYATKTNTTPYFFNVTTPPREIDRLAALLHANPCLIGHRPAWLVSGGMACGVCGVQIA